MENTKVKLTPVDTNSRKDLYFKAGDTVRVWSKIQEKGKTRLQAFEGLVLARKHGAEIGATFTVRKVASGVGVERIFPLYSPNVDKIEILKKSKTRKNKLYYIRDKAIKAVKKRLKSVTLSRDESEALQYDEKENKDLEEEINEEVIENTNTENTDVVEKTEEVSEESEKEEEAPEEVKEESKEETKE